MQKIANNLIGGNMKKIILFLAAVFVFTGCLDVLTEITIDNNDQGEIIYTTAMVYDEEMEFLDDSENEFADYEGAVIREIEYEKNGQLYKGEEVTIKFDSLAELNEVLIMIYGDEDESEVAFKRDGNRVNVSVPSDADEFEEMFDGSEEELYEIYDFQFTVQIEGVVIENNADHFDERTNTLTWETKNWLQNGVNLVYDTGDTAGDETAPIVDEEETEPVTEIDDDSESSGLNPIHLGIIAGGALVIGAIVYFKKK